MNYAQFTIDGVAPGTPQTGYIDGELRGFNADPGTTVQLALPVQSVQIDSVRFRVVNRTKGSPSVTLSNGSSSVSGEVDISMSPLTPTGNVSLVLPAGFEGHTLSVECTVTVPGPTAAELVFTRAIACPRLVDGGRLIMPGETTEHNAIYGWTPAVSGGDSVREAEVTTVDTTSTAQTTVATRAVVSGTTGVLFLVLQAHNRATPSESITWASKLRVSADNSGVVSVGESWLGVPDALPITRPAWCPDYASLVVAAVPGTNEIAFRVTPSTTASVRWTMTIDGSSVPV